MQPDNTVAIVALIVTGSVGILAPLIAGLIQRSIQRRQLAHATMLDKLAEQRRVIFAALDEFTRFEHHVTDDDSQTRVADEVVLNFIVHRLRLLAMFGASSEVGKAYQDAINALPPLVVLATKPDALQREEKRQQARQEANAARDRLVEVVQPYLLDKVAP